MGDALVLLAAICLSGAALALGLHWLGGWLFPLDDQADTCRCRMYRMDEDLLSITNRGIRHTHERCAPEDEQGQGTR